MDSYSYIDKFGNMQKVMANSASEAISSAKAERDTNNVSQTVSSFTYL